MKTFDSKEIIMLKEYLGRLQGRLTPFSKQKSIMGEDGFCMWCEEWETVEMLKYLINGKDMYFADPPPNRLKKSKEWSKEAIEQKVIADLDKIESVEGIIDYFDNKKEKYNDGT